MHVLGDEYAARVSNLHMYEAVRYEYTAMVSNLHMYEAVRYVCAARVSNPHMYETVNCTILPQLTTNNLNKCPQVFPRSYVYDVCVLVSKMNAGLFCV